VGADKSIKTYMLPIVGTNLEEVQTLVEFNGYLNEVSFILKIYKYNIIFIYYIKK